MAEPTELLYITMLCEPSAREHAVCAQGPDGTDDSAWFCTRLEEQFLRGAVTVTTVALAAGEALPAPDCFDCVVLGGTFHGVHDGRTWQTALMVWLTEYRRLRKPLLGICGGHQAMAVLLGGVVSPRPNGPVSGSVAVTYTAAGGAHPLFEGLGPDPAFHFGNGDHVTSLPANAVVLATVPGDSPAVALDYGEGWVSTQFHPEASSQFFRWLVETELIAGPAEAFLCPLPSGAALIGNFIRRLCLPDSAGKQRGV